MMLGLSQKDRGGLIKGELKMEEDFTKLQVWKKSYQFALDIYKLADNYPEKEKYRLTSQMCRAALSIPSNIAEGKARNSINEYIHFLYIARGSLEELRCQLMFCRDLGYISFNVYGEFEKEAAIVSKLLNGLIKSLKKKGLESKAKTHRP